MASDAELQFILKCQDQASSTINKLGQTMGQTAQKVNELSDAAAKNSRSWGSLVEKVKETAIAVGGLIAEYRGLSAAIGAFSEYEKSMLAISRTTKQTGEALDDFSNKFWDLSKSLRAVDGKELLQFAQVAGQLGLRSANDVNTFAASMAKLDSIFGVGEHGVMLIGRLLLITGDLHTKGVTAVTDFNNALAIVQTNTKATASQLVYMASWIAQGTSMFKMGSDKILGLAAAAAQLNFRPQLFSDSIGRSLMALKDGSLNATKGMRMLTEITGVTREQMKGMLEDHPEEAFLVIMEALKKITEQGRSPTPLLQALNLESTAEAKVLGTFSQNLSEVRAKIKESTEAMANKDTLDKFYKDFEKTTSAHTTAIISAWHRLVIDVGAALAPIYNVVTSIFTATFNVVDTIFRNIPGWAQSFIVLGGVAAITIPAVVVVLRLLGAVLFSSGGAFGIFASTLGRVAPAAKGMIGALDVLHTAFEGMAAAGGLASVFGVIGRAFTGLGKLAIGLVGGLLGIVPATIAAVRTLGLFGAASAGIATASAIAVRGLVALRAAFVGLMMLGSLSIAPIIAAISAIGAAITQFGLLGAIVEGLTVAFAALAAVSAVTIGIIAAIIAAVAAVAYAVYHYWGDLVEWWSGEKKELDINPKVNTAPAKKELKDFLAQSLSDADFQNIQALNPSIGEQEKLEKQKQSLLAAKELYNEIRAKAKAGSVSPVSNAGFNLGEDQVRRAMVVYEFANMKSKTLAYSMGQDINDQIKEVEARTGRAKNELESMKKNRELTEKHGLLDDPSVDAAASRRLEELNAQMQSLFNTKRDVAFANLLESINDQKNASLALSSSDQMRLEITTRIRDIQKEVTELTSEQVTKLKETVEASYAAARAKQYATDMRSAQQALDIARAQVETEKQELSIRQQIENFNREKGQMSAGEQANMKTLLFSKALQDMYNGLKGSTDPAGEAALKYADDLKILKSAMDAGIISATEYQQRVNVLTRTTLDSRNPYEGQLKSLREQMAALQIVGDYRDADVKSLQAITSLEDKGVQLTAQQKQNLIDMNRQLQDMQKQQSSGFQGWANGIGSLKDNLLDLEKSFASGLSEAIVGALTQAQQPWTNFFRNIGKQMLTMAVNQMLKELMMGSIFVGSGGGLSSGAGLLGILGLASKPGVTSTGVQVSSQTTGAVGSLGGLFPSLAASPNSIVVPSQAIQSEVTKQLSSPTTLMGASEVFRKAPTNLSGIDATKFNEALAADPALREKVLAISLGENKNPLANQAVMETMRNRMNMMGTPLSKEAKLFKEGGYYEGYDPKALNDPKLRAMAEENLRRVQGGSNIANYATDNASGDFALRRMQSGMYDYRYSAGGEYFLAPGNASARGFRNYPDWQSQAQQQVLQANKPIENLKTYGVTSNNLGIGQTQQSQEAAQQLLLTEQQRQAQKMLEDQMKSAETATKSLVTPISQMGQNAVSAAPMLDGFSTATATMATKVEASAAAINASAGVSNSGFIAGLFHSGSWSVGSGHPASGYRFMPSSMYSNAPRYHSGLNAEEYPAVLKRGEAVLTQNVASKTIGLVKGLSDRLDSGGSTKGVLGRQGGPMFNQNITVVAQDANSFRRSESQLASNSAIQMHRMASRNS